MGIDISGIAILGIDILGIDTLAPTRKYIVALCQRDVSKSP